MISYRRERTNLHSNQVPSDVLSTFFSGFIDFKAKLPSKGVKRPINVVNSMNCMTSVQTRNKMCARN